MLLGTRRAAGKGSTRELIFPLARAGAASPAQAGHLPSAGPVPRLLLAERGERAPTAACSPACTPPAPLPAPLPAALPAALPPLCCLGSPPGQVTAGPGASRGCEAWPRTKASSPTPSGDWGHSPVVLVAAGASLIPCGAQCLREWGRLGWAAGKLARPQASGLAPHAALLAWGLRL